MEGIANILRRLGRVAGQYAWTVMLLCAILGLIVLFTYFLFSRAQQVMDAQLRDHLRDTAAVAAMQFQGEVVDAMVKKPSQPMLKDVVQRLIDIRDNIPEVRFAYIMRRTGKSQRLAFVADADMFATKAELDFNGNGEVDEDEEPAVPGELYDISGIPALQEAAFLYPTVDEEIVVDKWGKLFSGYAPIRRADGSVAAVLGLDMRADDYLAASQAIFSRALLMLVLLVASLLVALLAVYIHRRRFELLEHIERERTGLLQLTYHQLGTPLTAFRWSMEMLKESRGKPEFEKVLDDYFAEMDDGISRMSGIVDMLREADRVHAGTIAYQPQLSSLDEVVSGVVAEFKQRADKQGITLVCDAKNAGTMQLDRQLIAGVLRELLGNALDYSESGTTVTVRTQVSDRQAQVEVQDQGAGIPRQDMDRIFHEFARGANAWHYKPGGTGLGLYIAKGIVTQAGGDIWARSVEGQGATFTFTLPVS